jgi:hypothetical protein
MTLRPPDLLSLRGRRDSGADVLGSEILAEKASSLGHHGRLVEQALQALRAHDETGGGEEARRDLVRRAAREVWAFLVQRELCGLRDQREVIRFYGIPPEVIARLGAVER